MPVPTGLNSCPVSARASSWSAHDRVLERHIVRSDDHFAADIQAAYHLFRRRIRLVAVHDRQCRPRGHPGVTGIGVGW